MTTVSLSLYSELLSAAFDLIDARNDRYPCTKWSDAYRIVTDHAKESAKRARIAIVAPMVKELEDSVQNREILSRARRAKAVAPRVSLRSNPSRPEVIAIVRHTNNEGEYTVTCSAGVYDCDCMDDGAPKTAQGSKLCKHVLTVRMLKRHEAEQATAIAPQPVKTAAPVITPTKPKAKPAQPAPRDVIAATTNRLQVELFGAA